MQTQAQQSAVPAGLENFDKLPDAARVRQPVVQALFACSGATLWRRVKAKKLPQPKKDGAMTYWTAGELRQALQSK